MSCKPELVFQRGTLFANPAVIRVSLDSFQEVRVSNNVDKDFGPEWSPDGASIAFTRNASTVWVSDADGASGRPLAQDANAFLLDVQWSPDGSRMLYVSTPIGAGASALYSAAVAGGSPVNLTPGTDAQAPARWSPDGSKILFVSNRTGNLDVFSMASNGSGQSNLSNRAGEDGRTGARWSPDGASIVFVGQSKIWTMNADGSNQLNLSGTGAGVFADPVYASNGEQIFYVEDPDNDAALFVMNPTGANQHSIDTSTAIDREPIPSPDGSRIAWTSKRDGNFEIYVSNADGTNPVRVTNNPADDSHPRWRPCSN
jgi:Tol biopolymer transport system component